MATLFGDFLNGNNSNDGTTYANRFKDWTNGATAARTAPGDTIRYAKSPDPTVLGSCTWTNASRAITIPAATILDIETCEATWTGVDANVTQTTSATRKQGSTSLSLAIAAGFTTGQVAYKTLGATLNCSSYQQLNFWIRSNATVAANTFRVDLCSDAVGAVAVDSFTVNIAINPANTWHKIVLDKGSALGSSINSINIQGLLDPGTATILVDNFFVSKSPSSADCLTLHSLVATSSSPTGRNHWYLVQSVTSTTLTIEGYPSASVTGARTYSESTQTVSTYVRQPIVLTPVTSSSTVHNDVQEAGSAGSPITYSGGWDTTGSMTTQNGETWVTTPNGTGIIFGISLSYISIEKFGATFATQGFNVSAGTNQKFTDCYCNAMDTRNYEFGNGANGVITATRCHANGGNVSNGLFCCVAPVGPVILDACDAIGNGGGPGVYTNQMCRFKGCTFINCSTVGARIYTSVSDEIMFDRCTFAGSATASILATDVDSGHTLATHCLFSESTEISSSAGYDHLLVSTNHDQVESAVSVIGADWRWDTDTTTVATGATRSWRGRPLNSTYCNTDYPARILLFRRSLTAAAATTFTVKVQRSNSAITARLVCPVQGSVVTTAQSASDTGSTGQFNDVSITVTAAVSGVADFYAECFGGTTHSAYFSTLVVS